jgi:hypothetical protein
LCFVLLSKLSNPFFNIACPTKVDSCHLAQQPCMCMILVKILIKLIQSFKSSQYSHVSSPQVLKYDISFGSQFLKSTVWVDCFFVGVRFCVQVKEVFNCNLRWHQCYRDRASHGHTILFGDEKSDINVIGIEPLMVTLSCSVMRKVLGSSCYLFLVFKIRSWLLGVMEVFHLCCMVFEAGRWRWGWYCWK